MNTIKGNIPLVRMPDDIQTILYLIGEELKSRRLFHALHKIGIDDCYFQVHLDSLILSQIGLDDGRDDTFHLYTDIMDKRCKKIAADRESVMKQALRVYHELLQVKKSGRTNLNMEQARGERDFN